MYICLDTPRDNDKDDWILPKMDIQLQLPKLVAPAAATVPSLTMQGDAGGSDGHGRVKPKRASQHNYDNSGSLTARANALSTLHFTSTFFFLKKLFFVVV
jgi:hypothetical protein